MPWDKANRAKYDHKTGRYPSDMTNAQWAVIEPLVPLPQHGGRPRTTDMREVINAIFFHRKNRMSVALTTTSLSALDNCTKIFFMSGPGRVYWLK